MNSMEKTMKVKWSDGKKFVIDVGQVWISPESGESDVIIDELTMRDKVYWHNPHEPPKTMCQFIHGTDGFLDFLESCCYRLKG